jgi:hypothetical protein
VEATEPKSMDDVIEMIASQSGPAPETTEDAQSEVSDTEEVETEASDEDTTEVETDEEAEPDEADADEADEEDAAEDEAEDDETDEPDLITVTVDGTEKAVTLDELKRGYSGQAKIQQDLASNAQTRKQLEAAATALMDQQNAILRMHQEVQQQGFRPQPQMPDPKLIDDNPQEYMRQRANFENEVAAYQQEQAQLAQLKQRQEAYAQQQKAQHVAKGFETLKARIPELADEKAAPQYAKKMMEAGTQYQFTPEELSEIDDPRALEVLNDAMKWRQLKAKQATSKAPPKPSRNVKAKAAAKAAPTEALKARQRMRKSGSVDDVAAFLLSK